MHGRQRSGLGEYKLEDVIREYGLLQSVLLEFLHREAPSSLAGLQLILELVNEGIREAAAEFQRARTQTDRWRAGERERLISAFKAATAATAILHGPELLFEFANDEYQRLFLDSREYLGLPVRGVFPELEGTGIFEQLDEAYRAGKRVERTEVPLQFRTADGAMKLGYYTYTFTPHFAESGQVQGLILMGIHVTEQVLARQAIQRSQEQLKLITDAIPDLLGYVTREERYGFVNRAYEQWFGRPAEEIVGLRTRELLGEEVHARVRALHQRALSGEVVRSEQGMRNAQGEPRHLDMRYLPDRGPDAHIRGFVVVGNDITERKQAEEAVRRSEEQLRLITDRLPAFVSYIDREGRYQFVNRTYEVWFGLKGSEIRGKKRRDFTTKETAHLAEPYERRALAGEPVRYENVLRKPSGEYSVQDVEFVPDRDSETGEIRGAIIVAHDITEQKKIRQALEEAVRARDEFLSIASHELKTPLTSIQLQTQMTKRNIELGRPEAFEPARVTRLVAQTDKSVQRLSRLVDDMLDISRIATGKLTFTPEKFDLCMLAQEVVERLLVQASASGAPLACECLDPVEGEWDRFRVDQVITNLITNALRYGEGAPVEVTVQRSGPQAVVKVRDQGPGISPENQERIFQRFERATSANSVSGLGLGLYISREIVERHGGSIRVESKPGQGASFIVELPLREVR
ncbi:PAS domain-containing protein [Archangium sp.]|uniref:sensor histidine kinase n=1 Tax=Archangium sp. TaxID=1872627 RepID=UPI002D764FFF|nr:PAS domain-containing protein [Archangium sp.]